MIALQPHPKKPDQTKVMVDGFEIARIKEGVNGCILGSMRGERIGSRLTVLQTYELAKQTWPEVA